jgi:hypothetical protein
MDRVGFKPVEMIERQAVAPGPMLPAWCRLSGGKVNRE